MPLNCWREKKTPKSLTTDEFKKQNKVNQT